MVAIAVAWPALAQDGPSFDCAKASTGIEHEICKGVELKKADRALATVYLSLLGRLSGPAKEHLIKDQVRWIGNRERACSGGFVEAPECLKQRFQDRTARLHTLGESGTYPFISEHAIVRRGKVGATNYYIDASYPQFDGATADFLPINTKIVTDTNKRADKVMPSTDPGAAADHYWYYSQSFNLYRPSPFTVTVETSFYGFNGGAHGYAEVSGSLVDLRSGQVVAMPAVFTADANWLSVIGEIVRVDLAMQFGKRPGFENSLAPGSIAKLLRQHNRYIFKRDILTVAFNQYEVGPYSSGQFFVDIPYSRLRPLLRPDGPLGGS